MSFASDAGHLWHRKKEDYKETAQDPAFFFYLSLGVGKKNADLWTWI